MKTRTLHSLKILAALGVLLQACSRQEERAEVAPEPGYLVVTDFLGKPVKVRQEVRHIGSLFAVASHLVAMFGEADRLVAIPQGNVRDFLFCEIYPEIRNARIVKGNNAINIEELAKKPRAEVFFINPEIACDEGQMRQLERFRTPVITLAYRNVEEQMAMVDLVGRVLGHEKEALDYSAYYREVIARISARVSGMPDGERKTVYHAINELLRTDQANTLSADWLAQVGVVNVALAGEAQGAFTISKNYLALEELLERNPDFILINGGDVYDYMERSPQLHNLKAWRNGNIRLLPLGITRWGHPYSIETPLAMLWTAKTVYPERFQDVDIEQETRAFYHRFFDYELSDIQLAKILSGRGYKEIKGSGR